MFYESLGHLDSVRLARLAKATIGFVRVFLCCGASSDEEGCSGFYVQICEVEDDTMREVLPIDCQYDIMRDVSTGIEISLVIAQQYCQKKGAYSR